MSKAKKFFAKAEAERLAKQKAIEDATPKSWEVKPWSSLDAFLVMALAEKFHPGKSFSEVLSGKPKKFLDVCFRLSTMVSAEVAGTTVLPVMRDARPFAMLQQRYDTYTVLEGSTAQFIEDKCHGMLIHNSMIYPVKVLVEDVEARDWGLANESTLHSMIAESAMAAFGIDKIRCHIMMFAQWGFSNDIRLVERSKNAPIKTPKSTVSVVG